MSNTAPPWKKPALALEASVVADDAPLEVVPKLYIGSIYAALNEEGLRRLGITHIVNASRFPPTFPSSFTYLTIDVRDHATANLLSCIPSANIFIEAGMDRGGVLVHCYGGRSRSAALISAFLMSSTSTGLDDVLPMLYKARPITAINHGFERSLRAYHHSGYDVYKAQQVMLRARIGTLRDTREANRAKALTFTSGGGGGSGRGYDDSDSDAKFEGRFSGGGGCSDGGGASCKSSAPAMSSSSGTGTETGAAASADFKSVSPTNSHKRERSMSNQMDLEECSVDAKVIDGSSSSSSHATNGRGGTGGVGEAVGVDTRADQAAKSILRGMAEAKSSSSSSSSGGGGGGGNVALQRANSSEAPEGRDSAHVRRPSLGASSDSQSKSSSQLVGVGGSYPMPSSKKPSVLSLSNPPIRLSRPGSSTIRVIPPLRGLGREFTCRWTGCGARLFSLVNIVREDMLPEPGHQDGVGACEGGGGGAQAEAKESDFGGAGAGAGAGDSKMDVDDDFTPHTSEAKSHSQAPPPTARASGAKSFGFGDDDTAAGRSSSGSGMDVVCVSPQALARVSDNRFPLPHLNVPSQGTVHAAGRGPVAGTSRLSAQESPRIAVPPSPSLSSMITPPSSSSSISSGSRVVIPSLATGLVGHGGNVWSPGSSRPQSAERRRWMARMSLLRDKRDTTHDNGDAKVTQVALADDATVHSYDGGTGKYVHLEHLPWMGQELLDGALEEGDISCPQCKHVIGSWSWNPHPRHTMGGRLQVPVIRVLRTTVTEAELGLDATPITTPRLPDDSPRLGGSRGNSAHSTPRDPAARPSSGRSQSGGGGGTPRTPRGVLLNAATAAEAK